MVREGRVALNDYLTIADALSGAVRRLDGSSESPRLDAELLLARAIDVPRSYVIAHADDELDDGARARFDADIERRAAGMPMAYIVGMREFWSMELMVSPAVLVPRPDTELLVELAIGYTPRRGTCRILDLGTGSGAVALAIARERPLADVVATDSSADAIAVAAENARQNDIGNVEFRIGDWCKAVKGERFDIVVSNPPYVRDNDPALAKLRFEPRTALAAGADGLDDIRRLAVDCRDIIIDDGVLLLEHGADQADAVAELLGGAGWQDVQTRNDLAGRPRVSLGRAPR